MKLKSIFFILFTGIIFSSCDISSSSSNTCPNVIGVGVVDVTGPETAAINETITFNVKFQRLTCATFYNFYEVNEGNTKTITANVSYDACSCTTTDTVQETKPYTFKALSSGTYTFKFKVTNDTFITRTVTVP